MARGGEIVSYAVVREQGPPHDRTFTVRATVGTREIARGVGRSKKDAEQEAARLAMDAIETEPAPDGAV